MTDKELSIKQYESLTGWLEKQLKLIESFHNQVDGLLKIADNSYDIEVHVALYEKVTIQNKLIDELTEEILWTWEQYKASM